MTVAVSRTVTDSFSYTRLHIAPLDESLLKVIIPSAVLPQTRNISYHQIETFPERNYGFVELPTMEAEKIKKRLHGATLKGTKVRIEQANPDDIPEPIGTDEDEDTTKTKKRSKKRKREDKVLEGVELTDRKVKRGWTSADEPKLRRDRKEKDKKDKKDKKVEKDRKKKREKSKYTDEPELLFKTKLTPTAATNATPDEKRKKKKKGTHEVLVHEFETTIKFPTFLKSSAAPVSGSHVAGFVEGKGWVDADDGVVEEVKTKAKAAVAATTPQPKKAKRKELEPQKEDTSSEEDRTASDESDSSSEENEGSQAGSVARPKSSGSANLTIKIPPLTPASSSKVHPLEALYKKSKTDGPPNKSEDGEGSFSFFGGVAGEEDEEGEAQLAGSQMPMTPYTRQELEFRNVRSAAPTPDTAHVNKTFKFWPSQEDVEEEDEGGEADADMMDVSQTENHRQDEEEDEGDGTSKVAGFEEDFYAQRSELNKAWRGARKTSRKEKRYRENKSRGSRAH
ncbi:hypothetical protein MKZ38_010597 [Zalerion maritima]|uniref:Uncharacterized protein n=1 Tax=Zalerion maritima TaxID=339359 RepID=A0AAD5WUZ6_9PEZI|nr:hypothetical protein MKZ38_010597 [Zalerion maritima]